MFSKKIPGIRLNIPVANSIGANHPGSKKAIPNPTAKSFGTKVRVISLTEVAACRMPIIKPTSRPKPSIGDATNTTTNSACLPISITDATSISSPTVLFSYGKAKLAAKLPIIKLQPSIVQIASA